MALLKKLVLASVVSAAMIAAAPSAMAKPAGKVANQSPEQVVEALKDTVTAAETTLDALQRGTDREMMMKLFKNTKQTAKTIESSVVLSDRDRALARVNKARSAFKKGKLEESEAFMIEAVERFKKVEQKYHDF